MFFCNCSAELKSLTPSRVAPVNQETPGASVVHKPTDLLSIEITGAQAIGNLNAAEQLRSFRVITLP